MTKRLLAIWQKFEQESLATAPMRQRQEMQKTFYWGAATLLSILQEIPDGASEEEGAAVFEELYQECRDYMKAAAADYRRRGRGFGKRGDRS